jgi:integrase
MGRPPGHQVKPDRWQAKVVVASPARAVTARRAAMQGPRASLPRALDRRHQRAAPAALRHRTGSGPACRPEQAGGLRFHDLRHSCATCLVDDGVSPNTAQRVVGHGRASTTLDLHTRRTDDSSCILCALDDEGPGDGATGALPPA